MANPVLRSGTPVTYIKNGDINHQIKKFVDKRYQSIALICKDEKETVEVHKKISESILGVRLVNSKDILYQGGICVVDVNSAKGLEFDAVIIVDASNRNYQRESIVDYKKLYVAMTRALHELAVSHDEVLTEALCTTKETSLEKIKKI